jgi:heme oxygenase
MTLYERTKDLHHACEQHPVGQRMVNGAITSQEWADWLWAMRVLHDIVDMDLPEHMDRHAAFSADLAVLPAPRASRAALRFTLDLLGRDTTGAAYVLHGAHCSGGRVLAPKMAKRGLPTAHTSYRDPEAVRSWLGIARNRADCVDQARATFGCLLAVMDEIERG